VDTMTPEQRSRLMSQIRSKDTKPELAVRSLVHRMGYRFRLHARNLPGTPDLVFSSRRKVIFVHGCFWHGHACQKGRRPQTRAAFWNEKIDNNRKRDRKSRRQLKKLGWSSLIVWECEVGCTEALAKKLAQFLDC
jgi:DNA mismatch endonuclease (patch repair protein)